MIYGCDIVRMSADYDMLINSTKKWLEIWLHEVLLYSCSYIYAHFIVTNWLFFGAVYSV